MDTGVEIAASAYEGRHQQYYHQKIKHFVPPFQTRPCQRS